MRRHGLTLLLLSMTACIRDVPVRDAPEEAPGDGSVSVGDAADAADAADAEPDPGRVVDLFEHPGVPKADVLLVVADSGSMCEEQDRLARELPRWLEDLLPPRVDLRLAVVSTDMHPPNGRMGRFLAEPAAPIPALNCLGKDGAPQTPNTGDCAELVDNGELPPILDLIRGVGADCDEEACVVADLARKVGCLVTLGTGGDGFEQGLEAMRTALSCDGPNAERFAACCVGGRYDPSCTAATDFLRPDAALVVVFVSDEDDCSHPPGALRRDEPSSCAWSRGDLTPVDDYRRFLVSLKARPDDQLAVAAIAGPRAYTASGQEVRYRRGGDVAPDCRSDSPVFEVERCCPDGDCVGPAQPVCQSEQGRAFAGARYQALVEAVNPSASAGCPPGLASDDPQCLSICVPDWARALPLRDHGGTALHGHCLSRRPTCSVSGRPCTPAERDEPTNYPMAAEVVCGDEPVPCTDGPIGVDLELSEPGCGPSEVLLRTRRPVPPGATLRVSYTAGSPQ